MKKLTFGLLMLLGGAAWADDYEVQLVHSGANPSLWTGSFNQSFAAEREGPSFVDTFTFLPTLDGQLSTNGGVFNFHGIEAQNVKFSSVTLNGVALTLDNGAYVNSATLSTTALSGPLVLRVAGTFGESASYAGNFNLNVAAVPEPETYALLLGGLGMVGALARRRRATLAA